MDLSDIKFVDLNHSIIDKGKSDPQKGKYVFKKKVYVGYRNSAFCPRHYVQWNRYYAGDDYKDIRDWQIKWNYSFVTIKDPYWPEGLKPDNNDQYRYGDLILMKCPIEDYVEKRMKEIKKSNIAAANDLRKFEARAQRDGVSVTHQLLTDMHGQDILGL